uniref:Uncharacterized protein n=1 Tax=Amphimedon queenslandica TaxID=400682 RepID=A0A1X7TT55_AMPQE
QISILCDTKTVSGQRGNTALIEAAREGNCDVVELLLKKRADPSDLNNRGDTALVLAAEEGHDDIVQLLSEEADPNTSVNNKKLYEAAKRGDSTGVQSALSQGANVNYQNPKERGDTALIEAARKGNCDVVELLLKKRADPSDLNNRGDTALIVAAREGNWDVVELLLKKGADPSKSNFTGHTALIEAAKEGHYDIVHLLLKNGADRNTAKNLDHKNVGMTCTCITSIIKHKN